MKRIVLLLLCLTFLATATACNTDTPQSQTGGNTVQQFAPSNSSSGYSDLDDTSNSSIPSVESGAPPHMIRLRSEEEFKELYAALHYNDAELDAFLDDHSNYGINGISNRGELEDFWEKTLSLKLPDLSKLETLDRFGLEYYPDDGHYSLWFVLGGRQYRFYYYPGSLRETEMVLTPVLTGTLHGAEIRLKELSDSPWQYRADFYLDGYNVRLYVRNDLNVTNPEPLFLNFSDSPWVTIDKNNVATFHLG